MGSTVGAAAISETSSGSGVSLLGADAAGAFEVSATGAAIDHTGIGAGAGAIESETGNLGAIVLLGVDSIELSEISSATGGVAGCSWALTSLVVGTGAAVTSDFGLFDRTNFGFFGAVSYF